MGLLWLGASPPSLPGSIGEAVEKATERGACLDRSPNSPECQSIAPVPSPMAARGHCSSYGSADSYGARGACQRSGGVEEYSSITSRQVPEHGSAAISPGPDYQRRDLLGAVDADSGAEHPAARAVAIRLVRCQSEALAHHASTLAARRPRLSHDAADNYAFGKHVIIVVTPLRREAAARLRTNWSPCQCQWFQTISRAATPPSTKKTEPKTR